MLNLKDFFQRAYLVNLDRRPDRLEVCMKRLTIDWPFVIPERWPAVDGKLVPHPQRWTQGGGAWGCLRSHMEIIEKCLNENVRSVLLLEDDAMPCKDFMERVSAFLEHVPNDWQMIYLGGQHLKVRQQAPERINQWVLRPFNVNRTHAFALTRKGMAAVYLHLLRCDWHPRHHIDHHLGRLHESRKIPVYAPTEWLVGQAGGQSNVSGRTFDNRFWQAGADAIRKVTPAPNTNPFIAIIGIHSSGSSAIAGVCYHLGVYFGRSLGGFYGNQPEANCGFEAQALQKLCYHAAPFPIKRLVHPAHTKEALRQFVMRIAREAATVKKPPGAKFPLLCVMGEMFQGICGERLWIVHCDRPLDDSIESLKRRQAAINAKHPPEAYEATQRWLWEGKQRFLALIPPERQLAVNYSRLISHTADVVEDIRKFLQLQSSPEQIQKAIASVKPSMQHVGVGRPQ